MCENVPVIRLLIRETFILGKALMLLGIFEINSTELHREVFIPYFQEATIKLTLIRKTTE
ncbi:MAG TPA: hypothetical protein HA269_06900 [Ferroplasma sp.]|nr:hypothetical protein [Ferroplasma sp.]